MEEERYIYTKIDGYYWIKDTKTNENYCANKTIVKLLNQQDEEIEDLQNDNEWLCGERQKLRKYVDGLIKENQQLKEQLKNEEQSHDLCIKSFEVETDKLRKQIKFESDARKRFVAANQQLKQSRKQLAVSVLEEVNGLLTDTIIEVTENEFNADKLCYLEEISSKFSEKIKNKIKKY